VVDDRLAEFTIRDVIRGGERLGDLQPRLRRPVARRREPRIGVPAAVAPAPIVGLTVPCCRATGASASSRNEGASLIAPTSASRAKAAIVNPRQAAAARTASPMPRRLIVTRSPAAPGTAGLRGGMPRSHRFAGGQPILPYVQLNWLDLG
jgi:hypothetical protein